MEISSTTRTRALTGHVPSAPASAPLGSNLPAGGKGLPPASAPASVESAVAQIQAYLGASQRQLAFSIDKASGQTVVRVINPASGEVIRQIPSEEVLRMAAALTRDGFHTINELT
jgi:flagellar protein FlaG